MKHDYDLDLPMDTVFAAINVAGQQSLMNEVETTIKDMDETYDRKMKTMTLTEFMTDINTAENRKRDVGIYVKMFNRAGVKEDFSGALCVSEWYRRNLFMYSLIQKQVTATDDKVMVLLGSGHAAMIQTFIVAEDQFTITELSDILK
jgi:hypothetical protein